MDLIEAAMKLVRQDLALANSHQRIRRRSGVTIARVAAARKGRDLLKTTLARQQNNNRTPCRQARASWVANARRRGNSARKFGWWSRSTAPRF
jgi:hypothetical protein